MIIDVLSLADGERETRYAATISRTPFLLSNYCGGVRNAILLISNILSLSPRARRQYQRGSRNGRLSPAIHHRTGG